MYFKNISQFNFYNHFFFWKKINELFYKNLLHNIDLKLISNHEKKCHIFVLLPFFIDKNDGMHFSIICNYTCIYE